MTDTTGTAFHAELRSFFALALLNIVFAALTLAFGVSIVVTQASALLGAGTVQPGPAAYLLLGGGAALVGLWWLPKGAQVLGDVDDIREEAETSVDRGPEEALRLMVRMMALYRDQREVIERMVLVSRIGGVVFLLAGALNLVGLVAQVVETDGAAAPSTPIGVAGVAVTLGMGVVALVVSALFEKYRAAWETRLAESDRVDAILDRQMERE